MKLKLYRKKERLMNLKYSIYLNIKVRFYFYITLEEKNNEKIKINLKIYYDKN